jgi:hypothetical protein
MKYLIEEFKKSEGIDLSKDKMAMQRLKEAAEKTKIELSGVGKSTVSLPFITADASGPKHLEIDLTKSKFESLIEDLVEETITLTAEDRSFEYGCLNLCSTIGISCYPNQVTSGGTNFVNNGAKTTITVTGGTTNAWSVISSPDNSNLTSNNTGTTYIGYKFGTYTIQSDECPEKTCTFKILEPEIKGIRIANNQPGVAKIYKTTQATGKVLLGELSNRGAEQVFPVTFDDHGSLDIEYDTNQWCNNSSCFVYIRVEGDNLMQIGDPTESGVEVEGETDGAKIIPNTNGSCSGGFTTVSGFYTVMINVKYAGYPCTGC